MFELAFNVLVIKFFELLLDYLMDSFYLHDSLLKIQVVLALL
jgi:hypothetical protein